MSKHYYSGKFVPRNTDKYKGDLKKITYRSGWERKVMSILDMSSNVLEWSSEVPIKYRCATDGQEHRYYIDFYVKKQLADGSISKELWEVKPQRQTKPPAARGKKKSRFLQEQQTYIKNCSKWEAAKKFAAKYDMKFFLVTEQTINNTSTSNL